MEMERVTSNIKVVAPAAVTGRVSFVVSVELRNVVPGRRITVTLEQKGADGRMRALGSPLVVVAEGDGAFVSFQVSLHERGTALLLATARDDAGATIHPDGAVVEVV